ncbi:hypothetical protein [Pelosinus fermentans]|uniref:hypothetical protein n=1 Tax=Pelosinus fermentans TaxID=365349 RepID=UPI00192D1801|nr:hypothetical protein [Pelosinus fermentans]
MEFILNILSSNHDEAMEQYLNLVEIVVDKPKYKDESVEVNEDQKTLIKAEIKRTRIELTWEQLVEMITIEKQVNQEQLLGKCRIRQVVAARKRLIYEVIERNLMTRTQLAKVLQIDPANITRIWQELLDS